MVVGNSRGGVPIQEDPKPNSVDGIADQLARTTFKEKDAMPLVIFYKIVGDDTRATIK